MRPSVHRPQPTGSAFAAGPAAAACQPDDVSPGRRRLLNLGLVAAGTAWLAACSSAPKPTPPTTVSGTLQASADVNPSVSQRPSPLLLRVYELRSAAHFNAADFMSLYQGTAGPFTADIVATDELTLQPGETRPYQKTLAPDTRFIAVFAAYRNLEQARWRVVVPITPGQSQRLAIRAEALAVTAQVQR